MKWSNYFDIYEELLAPFKSKDNLRFLEIGVAKGGSLQLWRNYFGSKALIAGLDIDPSCKRFEEENTFIKIGDQIDRDFLSEVVDELGPFDIILDDGGHEMHQQIVSFEHLYPRLAELGLYIVEDTHTSYWTEFGGGARKAGTLIEYMKAKIDEVNGFHGIVSDPALFTDLTRSTYSVSFYDSIVALRRRPRPMPQLLQIGDAE